LLLDTHVWIWGAEGNRRQLGRRMLRLLERAGAAGELQIATVSIFELVCLYVAGRLEASRPIEAWIRESVEQSQLRVADITTQVAIDGGMIPAAVLPDPFDRILVATARQLDLPLATRDRRILDYAARTHRVRVVDASA